ncbi:MAG: hypothetical protein WC471_03505 [Candidatus Woesearchaeota archaeon]
MTDYKETGGAFSLEYIFEKGVTYLIEEIYDAKEHLSYFKVSKKTVTELNVTFIEILEPRARRYFEAYSIITKDRKENGK